MAGHETPGVAFAYLCVPFPPFPGAPSPRDIVTCSVKTSPRSLITTFRPPSLLAIHVYVSKYGGRHHSLLNSQAICEIHRRLLKNHRGPTCHLVRFFYISAFSTYSHGAIVDDNILLQQAAGEIE